MKTAPIVINFFDILYYDKYQVDLFGIAHVKGDFILPQKMYVMLKIGRFV